MNNLNRKPRVFYVGMISTDAYGQKIGEKTYSGAAAQKMISVSGAMRQAGLNALIVSVPFVGVKAKNAAFRSIVMSEDRVPIIFLSTLRSRYLRKILSPFTLAAFVWRFVLRIDTVIFYNHTSEYIPALLILRLLGVKVVQDIEDAPSDYDKGIRGFVNKICFRLNLKLTNQRKMVVADHVARELGLEDYVVIRGVSSSILKDKASSSSDKWKKYIAGGVVNIHFGGTLVPDTGVDLFCAAVEHLVESHNQLSRPVCLKVTGIGDLDKIYYLAKNIRERKKNVDLEIFPDLSKKEYLALIDSCHASLSLRKPDSGMANTTFPSKVIEITSSFMALISTRIGDVSKIFSEDCAYFLNEYTAEELANIFIFMSNNPNQVHDVARAGFETCHRVFSPESVGSEMKRLI